MSAPENFTHLEEEASRWLVRRDAGFTPEQEREFEAWLAADLRHVQAFAEMDGALATLCEPRASGQAQAIIEELAQERRPRAWWRKVPQWGWVAAAAAVVVAAVWSFRPAEEIVHPAPTAIVLLPERDTLPDGTVVERNHDTQIRTAFEPSRRLVELVRGEAHFAVAHDTSRPFVVRIGQIEVKAVGTAFSIRYDPAAVEVLVTEGTVAVSAPVASVNPATSEPLYLNAGHKTVIPVEASTTVPAVAAVSPEAMARELSWRVPKYELSQTPLAEAIELFNRNNRVKLALADPSLGHLRVSGLYFADSPDGFARLLAGSLDLEVISESPDRLLFRRR